MTKTTLYIEDTEIKLLITKGMQVEKWASLLLEPSLVRDGVIVDEDQVAERIKALFELTGAKKNKVSISLGGLNSIFRVITLPELTQNLIPEALMNEARQMLPVPLEQVYLSYQRIESDKGENRFFLVAHPRDSTDVLVNTLYKAGIKPVVMDIAPLALARCANQAKAVIINSWLTYLDIIVMDNKIPQVIRSLSLPTEAVDIEGKLPIIAEELARTIAFYNSSNPTNKIDSEVPIFVSGDLVEAKDSWQKLVGEAGYPISVLAPPVEYPETFNPSQYMVNIGLALKEQVYKEKEGYYSVIDINTLPEGYRPVYFNIVRVVVPVAVIIGIVALIYGGLIVRDVGIKTNIILSPLEGLQIQADSLNAQIINLGNQTNETRAEVEAFEPQIADVENAITAKLGEIAEQEVKIGQQEEVNLQPIEVETKANSIESKITSLKLGLDKTDKDMQEVIALLPDNITLLDFVYNSDTITIQGKASTEDSIFSYARELRQSNRFTEVIISSVTVTSGQENEEEIKIINFFFIIM